MRQHEESKKTKWTKATTARRGGDHCHNCTSHTCATCYAIVTSSCSYIACYSTLQCSRLSTILPTNIWIVMFMIFLKYHPHIHIPSTSINIYISYFKLYHSLCFDKLLPTFSTTILRSSTTPMSIFTIKHFLEPPSYITFHQHLPPKVPYNKYATTSLLPPPSPTRAPLISVVCNCHNYHYNLSLIIVLTPINFSNIFMFYLHVRW